jgi:MFS family permease
MISRTPPFSRTACPQACAIHHHYVVTTPVPWRELFHEGRGRLTTGVLLVEFLVAVETLVVVAIMPAIKRDLGGLQYYGLVFTGFSLAALVAAPLGGRSADRRGPATPFLAYTAVFVLGTGLCAFAPSMPLLVVARLIQGFGAGGAYTVTLAAVTRSYSDASRARVLALLAGAWIVPGLLGPSFGALLASTIGWRWAFVAILPLIVLAVGLSLPALRGLPAANESAVLSIRWPLQLAAGLAALVAGSSLLSLASVPLIAIGALLTAGALATILPRGSLRAQPGMPAAILMIFLLIFAFIGAEYFIPLMLTTVRGRSLTEAGIVITLGTVSWSLGNWWQSRAIARIEPVTLARVGGVIVVLAIAGIALTLAGAPLVIPYVAWLAAGIGMGIAYPTVYLVIMRGAGTGEEGSAVSSQQVAERLALALGGGLGGACIALALTLHASLKAGLAGALILPLVAAVAALLLAPRLSLNVRFPLA